jgi:hypothetical protein
MGANQCILETLEIIEGSIYSLTIIFSPATKVLVEVKSSCTVPELHIRQPLRNNIKEGSI